MNPNFFLLSSSSPPPPLHPTAIEWSNIDDGNLKEDEKKTGGKKEKENGKAKERKKQREWSCAAEEIARVRWIDLWHQLEPKKGKKTFCQQKKKKIKKNQEKWRKNDAKMTQKWRKNDLRTLNDAKMPKKWLKWEYDLEMTLKRHQNDTDGNMP